MLVVDELLELELELELELLFEVLLPELPLPDVVLLLPVVELPLPEVLDPDDADCVPDDDDVAGVAARYITDRTSSSMRRRIARARSDRSTSSCPDVE